MSAVPNTIPEADDTSEADTFDWQRLQTELDSIHAQYKYLHSRVGYKTAARLWGVLNDWTPEGLEHMYAKIEEYLDARDQLRRKVTAARQRRHVAKLKGNDPDRKLITISLTRSELEDLEALALEIYFELENRPDRKPMPELRSAAVSLLLKAHKGE